MASFTYCKVRYWEGSGFVFGDSVGTTDGVVVGLPGDKTGVGALDGPM
jgi:hypothetical protein